jgi:8-oxo-dGTP diphosphatase
MKIMSQSEWDIATAGFFKNYPVEDHLTEGNSAMILGRSDQLWAHLVSDSKIELAALLDKHPLKTKYYHSVEEWMVPLILEHGDAEWILTTNLYVLEEVVPVKMPNMLTARIDLSFAQHILNNSDYKQYVSPGYIEDRLQSDASAGILVDNELVAWGLTHDDGSLGFLHVLKDHRNKGYGENILKELIRQKREHGKPVFGNIIQENSASLNLVTKLGWKFDRIVSWIKLK